MSVLILCHFEYYLLLLVAKHEFADFKLIVSSHFCLRKSYVDYIQSYHILLQRTWTYRRIRWLICFEWKLANSFYQLPAAGCKLFKKKNKCNISWGLLDCHLWNYHKLLLCSTKQIQTAQQRQTPHRKFSKLRFWLVSCFDIGSATSPSFVLLKEGKNRNAQKGTFMGKWVCHSPLSSTLPAFYSFYFPHPYPFNFVCSLGKQK